MRKGKMRKVPKSSLDRLSELPDSLIFHIFWFLPMKDVVRTTILSRRWNKLWTTTPNLNLDYSKFWIDRDRDAIKNFVNRVLIFWEGGNMEKLKIGLNHGFLYGDISRNPDPPPSMEPYLSDLDCWVYFGLGKKVQELYLDLDMRYPFDPYDEFDPYKLPHKLYSYSWLKVLSIVGCYIEINGNVRWDLLRSLRIESQYITASAIDKVLRGSPQLGDLVLAIENTEESWSIRSSSLKRLAIKNIRDSSKYIAWKGCGLIIWTPNVETLKISGEPFGNYSLMDVTLLTHAIINFYDTCIDSDDTSSVGASLRQIFPTIQQVEKLELSDKCIQVLGGMNKEGLISSSPNVKFLKLNNPIADCNQIVGVLEIFPELEMLTLGGGGCNIGIPKEELPELDTSIPMPSLQHLRTIQITCSGSQPMNFTLIRSLFKNTSRLEKMVMRGKPRQDCLLLLSQILLRMPRSSPKAQLVFFED